MKYLLYSIRQIVLYVGILGLFFACDDTETTGNDTEGDLNIPASTVVSLYESNNYTYESALHIPTIETAEQSDIDICWEGLTKDFQCHDMDPAADIGNATVVRIRNLSKPEIEAALSQDGLKQSDIDGYLGLETGGDTSCVKLKDFSFFGSEVAVGEEYVESDNRVYLLVLTTGTTPGVGARMMTFLEPRKASEVTTVNVSEGCDLLDFQADLSSADPLRVVGSGSVMDWTDLAPPGISRVMLGYYEGMTPADLDEAILDLMLIATKKWEYEIESGGSVMLSDLTDADNNAFSGFEGTGSWVFALLCESCQNPAPRFLGWIEPSAGAEP